MKNNNVFLAIFISFVILIGFQHFFVQPHQAALKTQAVMRQVSPKDVSGEGAALLPTSTSVLRNRDEIIKETIRVEIETPELSGSINLKGARFDDLMLMSYRQEIDKPSEPIVLLSPSGSDHPNKAYYAEFNWLADSISIGVPSSDSEWKADSKKLTPDHSVRLFWNNGQGLLFERTISVDKDAMFTITERVSNRGSIPITLYPYGVVARRGVPPGLDGAIVHEGALGVLGDKLEEYKYKDLIDDQKISHDSKGGWLGMTDKYWLVAMIPPQTDNLMGEFVYNRADTPKVEDGFFQTNFRANSVTIPAGGSTERVTRLFAGAKRVGLLDHYADQYDIPHFDRAIDFGWFYFLTRPFLYLLTAMDHAVGNMGLAILLFTVFLKLVTLPLSQKSYKSMSRMKAIQPDMKRIQERFANDRVRQSQEMMELYKREKVNPMSGCVPVLIQIPIFFALYKVLYVNIEMRGAPFYGWIKDMSAPDPTSWFNLFGIAPWEVISQYTVNLGLFTLYLPPAIQIGFWPILMGVSMLLQQKLSPQPPDPAQARILLLMPIFFTYLLASMPAGLVIYWTWSNLLGILQQWYIMRGVQREKAAA